MKCVPLMMFGRSRLPRVVGFSDDEIGPRPASGIGPIIGRMRLPNDPVGTTTVTFSGVHADSEIRVYLPGSVEAAGVESCVSNQVLSWPVYAANSPNNEVRVVIVHLDYKIKEFDYTATTGAQSIPVQQEPDKWYSNPA